MTQSQRSSTPLSRSLGYNKKMRRAIFVILGAILISMFLLVGCGRPTVTSEILVAPANTPGITPEPTIKPTTLPLIPVYGPDEYPAGMNPLTGLEIEDPSLLDRCPMVIKVSNYPRSGRPHAGLSQADLVFDYYIGEGMNRFAAIYYGQDAPQVGPIRSARLVDAQLANMYQGILAFKGAWYKVNEYIYSYFEKTRQSAAHRPPAPASVMRAKRRSSACSRIRLS